MSLFRAPIDVRTRTNAIQGFAVQMRWGRAPRNPYGYAALRGYLAGGLWARCGSTVGRNLSQRWTEAVQNPSDLAWKTSIVGVALKGIHFVACRAARERY